MSPYEMTTAIPESVTTPDRVETRIGPLEFFDGYPTEDTAQRCIDNLLLMRGVEVFLNWMPVASLVVVRQGFRDVGITRNGIIGVDEQLKDSARGVPVHEPAYSSGSPQSAWSIVGMSAGEPVQPHRIERTSIIGRADDIDRLSECLERDRLISLVGPGGAGKTCLAAAVMTRKDPERSSGPEPERGSGPSSMSRDITPWSWGNRTHDAVLVSRLVRALRPWSRLVFE